MKIKADKVTIHENNDPIFPGPPSMINENLKHDFTQSINTPLHKTPQKDMDISHHPVSNRKARQIPGRHH